ncbi:MAG: hypothetical protein Q8M16_00575 [Pirellulaceae bacterium]|nr:hypothetical protein [Pirellulaceae bacterium]
MIYLLLCYVLLPPHAIPATGHLGQAFAASAFLGFWYAPWVLSHYRLRQRLVEVWGWPRFNIVDLLSLSVWIGIIFALAQNAWKFHPSRYYDYAGQPAVVFATVVVLLFCLYLWCRATWLLQQCGVWHPLRRMVFLLFVLPAVLLGNVDAAMSLAFVLATIVGMLYGAPMIETVQIAAGFLFELVLLTTMINGAMRYVLGENGREVEPEPTAEPEPTVNESKSP